MHGQQNIKIIHSQFGNIGLKAGEDIYYVIFCVSVLPFLRARYFGWNFFSVVNYSFLGNSPASEF